MRIASCRLVLLLSSLAALVVSSIAASGAATASQETRIEGELSEGDFVPPEKPLPKELPEMEIESRKVFEVGGRRFTAIRGEASTLPEIPELKATVDLEEGTFVSRELFDGYQAPVFLWMAATVFDREVSRVTWSHPKFPKQQYEAIVGLDFSLFSSVSKFSHGGNTFQLLLLSSFLDTKERDFHGRPFRFPDPPQCEPGEFRIVKGRAEDRDGVAPLMALMALYEAEESRLVAAQNHRLRVQKQAEEWRKANPPEPEPRNVTIWVRPHRGSRYLREGGAR